jgi:hypothetical protein
VTGNFPGRYRLDKSWAHVGPLPAYKVFPALSEKTLHLDIAILKQAQAEYAKLK